MENYTNEDFEEAAKFVFSGKLNEGIKDDDTTETAYQTYDKLKECHEKIDAITDEFGSIIDEYSFGDIDREAFVKEYNSLRNKIEEFEQEVHEIFVNSEM